MPKTKKVGLGGSLGSRYGTAPRKRYVEIMSQMRGKHECPRCHLRTVKRLSVGIWLCNKCAHKFAGGAYAPFTKLGEVAMRAAKGATASIETESEIIETSKVAQSTIVSKGNKSRSKRKN